MVRQGIMISNHYYTTIQIVKTLQVTAL